MENENPELQEADASERAEPIGETTETVGRSEAPDSPLAAPAAGDGDLRVEDVDGLLSLELPVIAVLAETEMTLEQVLALGKHSVVSFKKLSSDPLEFYVNDKHVGRGKAIKLGDKFGLHIAEIGSAEETLKKLK